MKRKASDAKRKAPRKAIRRPRPASPAKGKAGKLSVGKPSAPTVDQLLDQAYGQFLDADDARRDAGNVDQMTGADRQRFQAISEICRLYAHPQRSVFVFPADIAYAIHLAIRDLADGATSVEIKSACRGPGAPPLSGDAREDRKIAVRYLAAVRQRSIQDAKPVAHVASLYKVDRRTVMRWQRDAPQSIMRDPLAGFPKGHETKFLKLLLKKSGKRYRMLGRGHAGVRVRAKRKKSEG